jgi:hypothetical protein
MYRNEVTARIVHKYRVPSSDTLPLKPQTRVNVVPERSEMTARTVHTAHALQQLVLLSL